VGARAALGIGGRARGGTVGGSRRAGGRHAPVAGTAVRGIRIVGVGIEAGIAGRRILIWWRVPAGAPQDRVEGDRLVDERWAGFGHRT